MKNILKLGFISILVICFTIYNSKSQSNQTTVSVNPWFTATQIATKVWVIDDHSMDNMYLVEGKDSALLIDTGMGYGKLDKFLKSITDLPVIVVNTHGHPDHAGGNYQFRKIYAHQADFNMIKGFNNTPYHTTQVQNLLKSPQAPDPSEIDATTELPALNLLPIKEGTVFDLGGRKIEVVEVPGHTKGSICLLDIENKILFSGDNDNTLVWLFLKDCLPLEGYLQSLQHLNQRNNEFTVIMPGHGKPLDKAFINDQITCAQNILDGKCIPEPYHSFVGDASLCKYQSASIAYDPKNLRKTKE